MFRQFAVGLCLFACGFISASDPGQPYDCSDFVSEIPGLTCTAFLPFGVTPDNQYYGKRSELVFDNEGRLTVARLSTGNPPLGDTRIAIYQFDGTTERRIAYFPVERFIPPGNWDYLRFEVLPATVLFDPINGRLLLSLVSECAGACPCYTGAGPCSGDGYGGRWMVAIEGFTTLYEIEQSYTPTPAAWSFRVPVMPEGFAAADHFDTYTGSIATLGDFSQAQPLQCDYPTSPPGVGDYLAVSDPLPNPTTGTGRYYLTTVTHQGQTRAGRRALNGVLRGRDPSALPPCIQPTK